MRNVGFIANKYWSFNKRHSSNVNVESQRFAVLYFLVISFL